MAVVVGGEWDVDMNFVAEGSGSSAGLAGCSSDCGSDCGSGSGCGSDCGSGFRTAAEKAPFGIVDGCN